jgi:hypothetical protein
VDGDRDPAARLGPARRVPDERHERCAKPVARRRTVRARGGGGRSRCAQPAAGNAVLPPAARATRIARRARPVILRSDSTQRTPCTQIAARS